MKAFNGSLEHVLCVLVIWDSVVASSHKAREFRLFGSCSRLYPAYYICTPFATPPLAVRNQLLATRRLTVLCALLAASSFLE